MLRNRAVAVVIRNGKVLLVRDKGKHHFSLPGGGIRHHESTEGAAIRELFEELGLQATSREMLYVERRKDCDFSGSTSRHKVVIIETEGKPKLRGHELDKFTWWNMKDSLPVFAHVKFILRSLGAMK